MNTQRFLQTPFWAEFKASHGWMPYYFSLHEDNSITPLDKDEVRSTVENNIQYKNNSNHTVQNYIHSKTDSSILTVLVRSFSLKLKKISIAYIPMAPEFTGSFSSDSIRLYSDRLRHIAENLKPFIPGNCICVRFDPPVDIADCEERDDFAKKLTCRQGTHSLLQAPVAIQPPDTVIVSLQKSEEELLAGMKSKWRYNIRLAEKKGVTVTAFHADSEHFNEAFDRFYKLFETTSERDGVSFHAKSYYKDLLSRGIPDPDAPGKPVITLYLAKHEDDYLAGIITLFCGREAVYLYGASGNIKRNYMPAYLLQWTAIKDAKQYGSPAYDFYGMPPTDDPHHPMHGLYLFKTGFGGQIVHRPGSFDVPLRKTDYTLYIFAEKFRAWWHKKLLKAIRRR